MPEENLTFRDWSIPKTGEEIVISGISGSFPKCENVAELRDALFNKEDLISNEPRWSASYTEVPRCLGKIKNIEKYDAGFFSSSHFLAEHMDPQQRIYLEKAIEAVLDAGINPSELEGTNTGVIASALFNESADYASRGFVPSKVAMFSIQKSFIPNTLSYHLKLRGPSYMLDTACSSSATALEHGYKLILNGQCDRVIIGGTHLVLNPMLSLQFKRLGVTGAQGRCRTFDQSADGYVRGDAVGVIILERAKTSRRVYCEVVHSLTNVDGYKEEGLHFPSTISQRQLLDDFYENYKIDPNDISYMEAHGTGTVVGDTEETSAIDEALGKKRTKPLLIGSVKSNLGHSEGSSFMASMFKAIIAMETGLIPPNLHYKTPKSTITGILEGRLQVVDEIKPLDDKGLIAINNFGFGGANAHGLFQHNLKTKVNKGIPKDDLPRLVCVSGRTEEGVLCILDDLKSRHLDAEHVALYQKIFRLPLLGEMFRGFAIVSKSGEITRSSNKFTERRPFILNFESLAFSWRAIAKSLFVLPICKRTINRLHKILQRENLNIMEILEDQDKKTHPVVRDILGHFAILMSLTDVFLELGLQPDHVYGNNLGILAVGYFNGELTLQDATSSVYELATKMAKQATNENKIKSEKILPSNITNGTDVNGIASNSIKKNEALSKDVSNNSDLVLNNAKQMQKLGGHRQDSIPNKAVILEVSSQICVNRASKGSVKLRLEENNIVISLLQCLGKLFEYGQNFPLDKLYTEVSFPVSRGTPMISPLIKWNHEQDWFVLTVDQLAVTEDLKTITVNVKTEKWSYIQGHIVDGRNLFPAAGYLYLAWQTLLSDTSKQLPDLEVTFENIKFIRATNIPADTEINLNISLSRTSGYFEIMDGDSILVTGTIKSGSLESYIPLEAKNPYEISMSSKDFYKELRLRGYSYQGEFRQLIECNTESTIGSVPWNSNYVTLIDHMLQMTVLKADTRMLYVPVSIDKMYINPNKHLKYAEQSPIMDIYCPTGLNIVKCGGIEIHGVGASPIAKKKILAEPVLEEYKFLPNITNLSLKQSLRVNLQLILDENNVNKLKGLEYIDQGSCSRECLLSPLILEELCEFVRVQPDITISSNEDLKNMEGLTVSNQPLTSMHNCLFVIGSNLLGRNMVLDSVLPTLSPNGFIISRENLDFEMNSASNKIVINTVHIVGDEKIVMCKVKNPKLKYEVVNFDNNGDFIDKLQQLLKDGANIIIYSQNDPRSGIIGFALCLRKELGCESVRCFFIGEGAPTFAVEDKFYSDQISKNMPMNIYKNGQWGSYRHLKLEETQDVERIHTFATPTIRGDLSSFKWLEGPISPDQEINSEEVLVEITYAALNFRDIVVATGRISLDAPRLQQESLVGLEFAGRDRKGKKIAGMVSTGGLSSWVLAESRSVWNVPDDWSLEDAATVSVVYFTVLQALIIVGKMKKGESILIHSATGGVGLGAINIALFYECNIFVTVGTQKKRDYLKKHYPMIPDSHIGNSRDTSFEHMIHSETKGRGVDMVLNSLVNEKLIASVRCLAQGGRFLEIGKVDMLSHNQFSVTLLEKDATFYAVMLDAIHDPSRYRAFVKLLQDGIQKGMVKPLPRTIFDKHQVEDGFRYMMNGNHIGKVLIRIKDEAIVKSGGHQLFKCVPRYLCQPKKSYIILGGLGGFGLELADWLILRGARKLVLSSRVGVKNGYQSYRIKTWRSYGVQVEVSTAEITKKEGCQMIINEANALGPVDAIFNLTLALRDDSFDNQTKENFEISLGGKAVATSHLDDVSRSLCPELRNFVVFSSVSCGRGNMGQTNYGMSNSIMERICEQRHEEGLPALAIQWGSIANVGILADNQDDDTLLNIGGTLQQGITNCLEIMDVFMSQKAPVVSSIVVAEKSNTGAGAVNIVEAVAAIIGLANAKTVSPYAKLSELGMNSMTAVEVKQMLEIEYQVILSPQDIRNLTFTRLLEIQQELLTSELEPQGLLPQVLPKPLTDNFNLLISLIGQESEYLTPIYRLHSIAKENSKVPKIIAFPGLEGAASVLDKLASNLDAHVLGVQYAFLDPNLSLVEASKVLFAEVEKFVSPQEHLNIIMYSFGAVVGCEVLAMLEEKGYTANVIFIDSSPEVILQVSQLVGSSEKEAQNMYISRVCSILNLPVDILKEPALINYQTIEEKITYIVELGGDIVPHALEYQKCLAVSVYQRLRSMSEYKPSYNKLKSPMVLFKPDVPIVENFADDYNLSLITDSNVPTIVLEGTHSTILQNAQLAKRIEAIIY